MTIPGIARAARTHARAPRSPTSRGSPTASSSLDRLLRARPNDQAVRTELPHRTDLESGADHAPLGRDRSRARRLEANKPMASALHRHQTAPREIKSRQSSGRAEGPDRLLARPLPQRALQRSASQRYQRCPGKLLHSPGRLKAQKRSEKPGQLQTDHVRTKRRKRSQHHHRRPEGENLMH